MALLRPSRNVKRVVRVDEIVAELDHLPRRESRFETGRGNPPLRQLPPADSAGPHVTRVSGVISLRSSRRRRVERLHPQTAGGREGKALEASVRRGLPRPFSSVTRVRHGQDDQARDYFVDYGPHTFHIRETAKASLFTKRIKHSSQDPLILDARHPCAAAGRNTLSARDAAGADRRQPVLSFRIVSTIFWRASSRCWRLRRRSIRSRVGREIWPHASMTLFASLRTRVGLPTSADFFEAGAAVASSISRTHPAHARHQGRPGHLLHEVHVLRGQAQLSVREQSAAARRTAQVLLNRVVRLEREAMRLTRRLRHESQKTIRVRGVLSTLPLPALVRSHRSAAAAGSRRPFEELRYRA